MLYFASSSVIISLLAGITLFAVLRAKTSNIGGKPTKLTNQDIKIGMRIGAVYLAIAICALMPVIIVKCLLFFKSFIDFT